MQLKSFNATQPTGSQSAANLDIFIFSSLQGAVTTKYFTGVSKKNNYDNRDNVNGLHQNSHKQTNEFERQA